MSVIHQAINKGLLLKGSVPKGFPSSVQYETIMGSVAYGVSGDGSDFRSEGFVFLKK